MIRGFEEVSSEYLVHPDVDTQLPTRGTLISAGSDFYLKRDIVIFPQDVGMIYTDVKAKMLPNEVLKIHVRSSIGIKYKLMLANCTGVIDADYYQNEKNDGNIIIPLYNYGTEPVVLKKGDRVAQGVFLNYLTPMNVEVLEDERRGGCGSTGN